MEYNETPSAGQKIKVSFSAFSLEEGFDFLNVYNGADTNAPFLAQLTGNTTPGNFISTAADGSLTFEFISDEIITQDGWSAWVSCQAALSVNEDTISGLSYAPNPTNGLVRITAAETINEISIYAVTGQLLLTKTNNTTDVSADISPLSAGIYFFKVKSGTKQSDFKIVKQY